MRLKELRKARDLTVDDLGERLGWTGEKVSAIERGDRKTISLEQVEALCAGLGVDPADLFGVGEPAFSPLERDVIAALRSPGGAVAAMRVLLPEIERNRHHRSTPEGDR